MAQLYFSIPFGLLTDCSPSLFQGYFLKFENSSSLKYVNVNVFSSSLKVREWVSKTSQISLGRAQRKGGKERIQNRRVAYVLLYR